MLERRTPLQQLSTTAGAIPVDGRGSNVVPLVDTGYLLLQGDPLDTVLQQAILEHGGCALPAPRTASTFGEGALLWMTPKEWLIQLPLAQTQATLQALTSRFTATLAAVTDISDSLAAFDIDGARSVDTLMTACSLDLTPHAFARGTVARSAVADIPAVLWKTDTQRFRCLVDRSYAGHLWDWLTQSPATW